MNIKEVIIKKIPGAQSRSVFENGEVVQIPAYNVYVEKGESIGKFISRVLTTITDRRRFNKYDLDELIFQIDTVLWINFNPNNNSHQQAHKLFLKHRNVLSKVRGKQPRKDQERLDDIVQDLKYTCENLIARKVYSVDISCLMVY